MPELSIILVTRNDDYGELREERFIGCLRSLIEGARYIQYELIVVDWNPPKNKPEINVQYKPVFDMIEQRGSIVKHLIISESVHKKFDNPLSLDLFEFPARNAGIRLSTCPYVLVISQDLYITGEIWEQTARHITLTNPNEKVYFRCTRCDVKKKSGADLLLAVRNNIKNHAIEEYLYSNITQIHSPIGTLSLSQMYNTNRKMVNDLIKSLCENKDRVFINGGGDFLFASRKTFDDVSGFCERTDKYYHMDGEFIFRLRDRGYREIILDGCVLHIEHRTFHQTVSRSLITKEEDYRKIDEDNPNYGLF